MGFPANLEIPMRDERLADRRINRLTLSVVTMDSERERPIAWELTKRRGVGDGERFVLRFIEKNRPPGGPLWTIRRGTELTLEPAKVQAVSAGISLQSFYEALARARHDFNVT